MEEHKVAPTKNHNQETSRLKEQVDKAIQEKDTNKELFDKEVLLKKELMKTIHQKEKQLTDKDTESVTQKEQYESELTTKKTTIQKLHLEITKQKITIQSLNDSLMEIKISLTAARFNRDQYKQLLEQSYPSPYSKQLLQHTEHRTSNMIHFLEDIEENVTNKVKEITTLFQNISTEQGHIHQLDGRLLVLENTLRTLDEKTEP